MSDKKNILLVEDEEAIAYALRINLQAEGYAVVHCTTAAAALDELENNFFDLLVLDVTLPDKSGFEVCRYFRERDSLTPVIFVSALNDSESRVKGLRMGADDFITKPFNLDELLLKVKRLIFKAEKAGRAELIYFGNCWIDFNTLEAKSANGNKLKMSKLEYDLARLLIDNENKALSRSYIYQKIWGYELANQPSSRTLDNFIVFLRKYFEADAAQPKHFLSVRGVGYKFKR